MTDILAGDQYTIGMGREKTIVSLPKFPSLIWADRAGLVAAFALAAMFLSFWFLAVIGAGMPAANHLVRTLTTLGSEAELFLALPFWALLRAIDFFTGGAERRARLLVDAG